MRVDNDFIYIGNPNVLLHNQNVVLYVADQAGRNLSMFRWNVIVLHSVFTVNNNLLNHYLANIFGFQRSIIFSVISVYGIIFSAISVTRPESCHHTTRFV